MNGTSIDKLRMMQQLPPQMAMQMQQPNYGGMMTGDGFGDDGMGRNNNMDALAKEVSGDIDELNIPPIEEHFTPPAKQTKQITVQIEQKNTGIMGKIPVFLREPTIIVLIYVILSLDIVKKTLSSYIPQIKPTSDGGVMFIGIVIYAMIMAILFVVIKKLLL